MAALIIILAAIAAAILAAIAWLASVTSGFTCPPWCETTAVLILAILVLIGHVDGYRNRP
ncbi:MAG TPA: hypothetical protein VF821_13645 [Lentzea sp.]